MGMDLEEWEGGKYVEPPSDCNWDFKTATNYIKNIRVVVIYNQGRFQQDKYGQKRVEKHAMIESI